LFCDHPVACASKSAACFDANWGPQDASHPTDSNKLDRMTVDQEHRLLQGMIVVQMGSAVAWKSHCEKRVSRSSCDHANDECCELMTQGLRLVMEDVGLADVQSPTELCNNNQGCVDWTKGWANRKMRHMNIREMEQVRESQLNGGLNVNHIEGKLNPSDLLTQEHKTGETCIQLCNPPVVPSRSDGGCRNPASGVLSPEQDRRKNVHKKGKWGIKLGRTK
jgi:hypothetical protein